MITFCSILSMVASTVVWRNHFPETHAIGESYDTMVARKKRRRQLQQTTDAWDLTDDITVSSGWGGDAISLSDDGLTLAVGFPLASCDNGASCGVARVYERADTSSPWTRMGQDLIGGKAGVQLGASISISGDGKMFVVGVPLSDKFAEDKGLVRTYRWNEGTSLWERRGADLYGQYQVGILGSISLSGDGRRVVYGMDAQRGHVKVYQMNESFTTWSQMGSELLGENDGDLFGRGVAISSDGGTIAVGARRNADGGYRSGHVRAFRWTGSQWGKVGQDIAGEHASDKSGLAVALSADGNILAIGGAENDDAGSNAGHIRVFQWSSSTNHWIQMGGDINGLSGSDKLADAAGLTMSADGLTLAAGCLNCKHVRVFKWSRSSDSWVQIGAKINGKAAADIFGRAVSISSDGMTLSVSCNNPSYVQVLRYLPEMVDITIEGDIVNVPLAPQEEYRDINNIRQDTAGYYLEPGPNNSNSIVISGNQWKALALPGTGVEVAKGTTLEFDFTLGEKVDFHSICLAKKLQVIMDGHRSFCFCLARTQSLAEMAGTGIIYNKIETTAVGENRHYSLPIWKHFLGQFQYLAFIQDNDTNDNSSGNAIFSNIKFETVPPIFCI